VTRHISRRVPEIAYDGMEISDDTLDKVVLPESLRDGTRDSDSRTITCLFSIRPRSVDQTP
jgi:hypothetical protein